MEFPPHNIKLGSSNDCLEFYEHFKGNVFQYAAIGESYLNRTYSNPRVFRSVFPSWDNTARTKERALVVLNGVPENYEFWLSSTIDRVMQMDGNRDQLVFINAWNEWAEGCHLEPDRWFLHGFLQATWNAKQGIRQYKDFMYTEFPKKKDVNPKTFRQDVAALCRLHVGREFAGAKRLVHRRPWVYRTLLPFVRFFRMFFAGRNN